MDIQAIRAFLETNKDQTDVQSFLGELSAVSADKVKGFLQTEEGKKVIQPDLDRYHAKSLESWKANNLNSLVEAEVKKRNPDKSPLELEVEKLKNDLEARDKASQRLALKNKALAIATDKKLSIDDKILDRFIAEDEASTLANIEAFEAYTKAQYQAGVESVYKTGGRNPGGGNGGSGGGEGDSLGKKLAEASKTAVNLEEQREGFFK